jgi:AcrR family transcriptional regulator
MNMAARKTRGRPKNATLQAVRREQILDAAAPIFAQHGYRQTDVQFVADALGLGKGTVYRYFPSKAALFLAAADRGMRRCSERIHAAVAAIDDPLEVVVCATDAYLKFFQDHPEHVELLIQERAEFRDRKKPTYYEHRDAQLGPWQDLLRGLIAAGRIRPIPVERVAAVISDLLYGTMFTNYFADQVPSSERQAEAILDVVFHGILTDAERARRRAANPHRKKRHRS